MPRDSTVANYNTKDRALEWAIDIYFFGASEPPLRCTRNNYLVDCSVLLEACANAETFVGVPSSNEVSFRLLGQDGLFNPAKVDGPYYMRMRTNLQVKIYCRPLDDNDPYNWDPLGVYYVTEWQTDITGVTADVSACDTMYTLLSDNSTSLQVKKNYSYADLCQDFFDANDLTIIIDGDLSEVLDFAYIDESNSNFLANFSIGALAYIFCDVNGIINILDIDSIGPVDFTITDSDQIVSVTSQQSAMLSYNGIDLTYYKMQLSDNKELLNNKQQQAAANFISIFNNQVFSSTPVYAISSSKITAPADLSIDNLVATAVDVSYNISNATSEAMNFDLQIFGYAVDSIEILMSDNNAGALKLANKYIQNNDYASRFKTLMQRYLSLAVPVLELEVRGNPLITIGSKVHVVSNFFDIDFTGILIRQNLKYDGSMSGTMTLLNSDIVRE